MASHSLASKLIQDPEVRVVISPSGEPSHLQIPWKVVKSLTNGEWETLDILSDPWWAKVLPQRLQSFLDNPKSALKNAVSLKNYRAQNK